MKKIFFVLPSMEGGGAERVVSVLSNYFANKEYEVSICLFNRNLVEYNLDDKVVINTEFIRNNSGISKKISRFKDMRNLLKENPDALFISFFSMYNIYLLLAGTGLKNKIVVSERLDPRKSIKNSKLLFKLRDILYSKASKIVFQTKDAKEFFPQNVQEKGIIIPNPLKEGLPERYEGQRRKEVVTFARLEPQKNYPLLIDAFEKFSKTHSDYTLAIYGKGTMEEKLKEIVKQKNLQDIIKFYGFSNSLHSEIRDAAMFVLPSDYEGLSNSMLEALAIGMPTVCTDCPPGGARMFIESNENGILVPVRDADSMCNAMTKIADDKEFSDKLSKNAVSVREQLKCQRICEIWEENILSLFN